ncbi:unnamed protein product, partial [Urochloa humidicola]
DIPAGFPKTHLHPSPHFRPHLCTVSSSSSLSLPSLRPTAPLICPAAAAPEWGVSPYNRCHFRCDPRHPSITLDTSLLATNPQIQSTTSLLSTWCCLLLLSVRNSSAGCDYASWATLKQEAVVFL